MKSFLFFLCFTFVASLYRIAPSIITTSLSVVGVTMLSGFVLALKLVPSRSRYDPLMTGHGGTSYDMHEMLFIVPPLVNLLFAAAAIFVPYIVIPTVYFLTVFLIYVIPTAVYLMRRISFYRDVKDKVRENDWRMYGNIFDFIFTGRGNVHNVIIETQNGKFSLGILGGIGAMRYVIENGEINARRVLPMEKKYAFLDYGGDKKEKVQLFGFGTKKRMKPLPKTSEDRAYLMLQSNAFIVSNGFLVDIGEEVEGMRVLNMETGMNIVR